MDHLELVDCEVDLRARTVLRPGRIEHLTTAEARLLAFLVAEAGRDIPRDELLARVWQYADGVVSRAADATITRLRAKIERDPAEPDHLRTVWGTGYRFDLSIAAEPPVGPEPDRFVGRDAAVADVVGALAEARVVTVLGPAGMGKTRLASNVARALAARGERVVVAVVEDGGESALRRVVAQAVGRRPEALDAALAEVSVLVLDNAEAAVEAAAGCVTSWIPLHPGLRILATSREALRVAAERRFELGPLDPASACELFVARAADPDLRADTLLQEVVARLEGVPLAIEIAAGLTDVLDLAGLGAALERPLDLESHRRDHPDRHRSLRRALDGSWATLAPAERRALAACSVLRAPFRPEVVEELTAQPALDALRGLRAKSLVRREGGALALYGAVRAYARERLRDAGDEADVVARHRAAFASRAEAICPIEGGAPDAVGVAWLAAHRQDLRDALRTALADGSSREVGQLAWALYQSLMLEGPLSDAIDIIERALSRADLSRSTRGHLHRAHANLELFQGHGAAFAEHLDAAEVAAEGDLLSLGRVLGIRGVATLESDPVRAIEHLESARRLHEEAGDRWFLPVTLGNLASAVHQARGRAGAEQAAALYEEAGRRHEAVGNARSAAVALGNRATLFAQAGDLDRARDLLQRALSVHRDQRDRFHECITLGHLGVVAMHRGDLDGARELLVAAHRARLSHGGDRPGQAIELRELAVARHLAGELERAREARKEARGGPDDRQFLELLDVVFQVDASALDDARAALARWTDADVPPALRPMFEAARGLLALATGDVGAARAAHAEAISLRVTLDLPFLQADRLYIELLGSRLSASEGRNDL